MNPIRKTILRVAALGLLAGPLAGCGIENAVGPVANARTNATSEFRAGVGVEQATQVSPIIVEPSDPAGDSQLSTEDTSASLVSGDGKDKPKKEKKPKKHPH